MSQFHHRGWHNSIAVGNYLYIDGGEVATWNGKGQGFLSIYSYYNKTGDIEISPELKTYSIDLSKSWTNQSATLVAIDKGGAPVLIGEALWPDANEELFYMYDGSFSDQYRGDTNNNVDYSNKLWQFSPRGSGGVWSLVAPSTGSNFESLSRTTFGSYASGYGVGFALGGGIGPGTDESVADTYYPTGLVVYNTTSQNWYNVSSTGYAPSGKSFYGAGQFVPTFGESGLLFFMGGVYYTESDLTPFDSVSIYDPTTQQWAAQVVSGDIPKPCAMPCIVGAAGDNGTYEIFLYGGAAANTADSLDNGAVHVLTLPAFTWLKQSNPSTSGRVRHTCNVVGNRQMVVVGGLPITQESGTAYIPPDPWPKGLGIFDLSAMEWASGYDPHAAPYVTPDLVKSYYQQNNRYPTWSSTNVQQWFTSDVRTGSNSSQGPGGSSDEQDSGSSSTNVGAIVGGVIGGVAFLLLIAAVVWLVRRKKGKERATELPAGTQDNYPQTSMFASEDNTWAKRAGPGRLELHGHSSPGEAASTPIYELQHDGLK